MAAKGDVFSAYSVDVADDGYLDILPAAGHEAVIHNIYWEDDVTIEWFDGTNSLVFRSETGAGGLAFYAFHVTNSIRIRVRNVGGEAHDIGYDGIYTKVT